MLAAGTSHTPHTAPRGAQHYTRLHDTLPCLRRAPATHRTKHPEGHNTTQGCMTHCHACGGHQPHTAQSTLRGTRLHKAASMTQRHACGGGHQPHTAQSTLRGTTLHEAARHNAMLAAGFSHTPHKAPRGAQHYDITTCGIQKSQKRLYYKTTTQAQPCERRKLCVFKQSQRPHKQQPRIKVREVPS